MHPEFEKYLKENTSLTQDDIHHINNKAFDKTLHRNELLLQAGDICKHKVFVVKGLLRMYSIDSNGNEHILQFAPEHSWTLDVESYDKQIPSEINMGAIEPTEVMLWQKDDFNKLLSEVPELSKLSQQIISRNIYYSRQRMLTTLSATPEEKYDDFIERFPKLLTRLPLRMIASYLGISIKTLTRIRHNQLHR
ncbi:cyclic nucleotide-binding domain-containing protein [Flavobacterium rakeshii]|uniref:Cyclic nucleotide-binding domain-containing protein n=1 Tax=Flavobacterium rakeshii TaxID=1038845 RepID=A0A6N8HC15_9FLAO|nr:Crp/Fnr family transcriptional regulator [Flavobacterium rakeshii]MEE1896714.1 Crp/Fnr family transcriptional regulator [Flavobacterium rakeshii]MUV03752.1 cyclic nucleotide-binding domain-containing protein [Flavobacterium rakeshii]